MTEVGVKFDAGKPRYDLIPPEALHALAVLYGKGAKKYGDRNWERGMSWGRIFRALIGHAFSFWMGEDFDQDDGQHHLIAVAWNAFSLYCYQIRKVGEDDRSVRKGQASEETEGSYREGLALPEVQTTCQEAVPFPPFNPRGFS